MNVAGEQLAWSWLGPRPRRARRLRSAARRPPPSRPPAEQLRLRLASPPVRPSIDELALGWMHRLARRGRRGDAVRPRRRADCGLVPRPCPWVGCRHHLAIDVVGRSIIHHPNALEDLEETCSLDVAERTSESGAVLSLYDIARLVGRRKETIVNENRGAIQALREAMEEQ